MSEEDDLQRHRHREPEKHSHHPANVLCQRELQFGEPGLHFVLELGQLPVGPVDPGVRLVDPYLADTGAFARLSKPHQDRVTALVFAN